MKLNNWIVLAAVLFSFGCAAFKSGDVRISKNGLKAMLSDKTVTPFAEVRVTWKNFPYKSPADYIGEGSVLNPPKQQALPVPPGDLSRLREHAKNILGDAGLYNAEKGSGTLELEMNSINRWTYKELLRGFMVETPFILIIPASFKTGYHLAAGFDTPSGTAKIEETAERNTVFHILLIPLYPFFSPGAKENSLIKNMLWKASTDIYEKMRHPAALPKAGAGTGRENAPAVSPEPDITGNKKAAGEAAEAEN